MWDSWISSGEVDVMRANEAARYRADCIVAQCWPPGTPESVWALKWQQTFDREFNALTRRHRLDSRF